ncbi:metal ABC transporter permease [Bartonella sp. HY329]|uniref:metal ABC transporter permease n=1 Tax=unclassified Bartonella TaxID=2645622 RepID=UPI0021C6788B|nr:MULTISPECIES: metal ABC transporter permease [unclassified Bartonella]UXM93862.1 metal ABC transporter permease [Bartonella sp. HY329]UXN08183.1 metal ABC transporter permease [Bartonella sp. HY328]
MFDDFFVRAMVGCIGIALAAGPLGCIVVWRRMAYFGDTMAHSALLGVALALMSNINMTVCIFIVTTMLAIILLLLQRRHTLSNDSLLGVLSHSSLAISLIILSFLTTVRQDLVAYLFGDVLSVSRLDLAMIWLGGVLAIAIICIIWRPLIAGTVNNDLAKAEGLHPEVAQIIFMLMLALIIAVAIKIIGILLITALLILPAATARRLSSTPEIMALLSSVIGIISSTAGLQMSKIFNTPSGPSIVVAAFVLFVICLLPFSLLKNKT